MGLGVLEANTTAHVPGTVLLDQQAAHSEDQTGRLKHGAGKNSNIVLSPQPSEDPNDPLNWSQMKKHVVLAIIFFGVIIHGVVPVRNPSQRPRILKLTFLLGPTPECWYPGNFTRPQALSNSRRSTLRLYVARNRCLWSNRICLGSQIRQTTHVRLLFTDRDDRHHHI